MNIDKTNMAAKHPSPPSDPAEQADYWLTLSHSPLFDAKQQQALQDWLETSTENRQEWQKAQAFWQQTSSLSQEQITELEQHLHKLSPQAAQGTILNLTPRRNYPVYIAAAACLLLSISLSFSFWPVLLADHHTAKGEQQTITLTDGSSIVLNTDTALSVDFTQHERNLTLYGGEAYFKVSPDAQRPFTVHTSSAAVTALGTAFDVKQLGEDMKVTVLEHAVKVTFKPGSTIERLKINESVEFKAGHNQPVTTVNLTQAKAWREHRLVFKNQSLQEVTAELERYRPGKIVILNKALAQHLVTGVFDPRDTEAALTVIENTLGIKEYRLTDKLVMLTSAD